MAGGRPRKINKEILGKLEEAFLYGLSDREACLYANINPSTLYDYCKLHPKFSERKELLKEKPKMRAKMNLAVKIANGDIGVSKYYLERKARDEFGDTPQVAISDDDKVININIVPAKSDNETSDNEGDEDGC